MCNVIEELRECSICNTPMIEGYIFDGGAHYACNDRHRNIICFDYYNSTWEELYTDEGDSYFTNWFEEYSDLDLEVVTAYIEAWKNDTRKKEYVKFVHEMLLDHYINCSLPVDDAELVIEEYSFTQIEKWLIKIGYDLNNLFKEHLEYEGL